jgi:hypothetical protein
LEHFYSEFFRIGLEGFLCFLEIIFSFKGLGIIEVLELGFLGEGLFLLKDFMF